MVCATKDKVYLSEDAGLTWKYYDAPRAGSSGVKAVAVASIRVKKDESYVKEDYVYAAHAAVHIQRCGSDI